MESASCKKRKNIVPDGDPRLDEDEDENEEEKIEKFYALIKRLREARERLMGDAGFAKEEQTRRKKTKEEEAKNSNTDYNNSNKHVEVWKPSFQREDFMEEAPGKVKNPTAAVSLGSIVGASHQGKVDESHEKKEESVKEGLDLTLSL